MRRVPAEEGDDEGVDGGEVDDSGEPEVQHWQQVLVDLVVVTLFRS